MFITQLKLKNWRNFRQVDLSLSRITYLIGPNASGKSNILDALRFLHDIAKPEGGGLQRAIRERGGIAKLRSLHGEAEAEVVIEATLAPDFASPAVWRYRLAFTVECAESQRPQIVAEEIYHHGVALLKRPDHNDREDQLLRTETHLEQSVANRMFRAVVHAFDQITYLHPLPQLLKYREKIGGNRGQDDPYMQDFLERIAGSPSALRKARIEQIEAILRVAVPQFAELRFEQDVMGSPHLATRFSHHRLHADWQREEYFSDGTLRLLALLWSLQEGAGVLLLEEPELSLHEAVVEQIPALIDSIQRSRQSERQLLMSTHSEALLRNPAIDPESIILLTPGAEGSIARGVNEAEKIGLNAGLTIPMEWSKIL